MYSVSVPLEMNWSQFSTCLEMCEKSSFRPLLAALFWAFRNLLSGEPKLLFGYLSGLRLATFVNSLEVVEF